MTPLTTPRCIELSSFLVTSPAIGHLFDDYTFCAADDQPLLMEKLLIHGHRLHWFAPWSFRRLASYHSHPCQFPVGGRKFAFQPIFHPTKDHLPARELIQFIDFQRIKRVEKQKRNRIVQSARCRAYVRFQQTDISL